jgi:penicillin amidase
MPRLINPASGYIVAANNDPVGDTFDNNAVNQLRQNGIGIRYLGADYNPGLRARRLGDLLEQEIDKGRVRGRDLEEIQADVVLPDAEFFIPFLVRALNNASRSREPALAAFAGNPRLIEAVARLRKWSHAAPTGVPEGYDAADDPGHPGPVTAEEAADSVAATIYSVWRAHLIGNTVDRTLASVGLGVPPPRYAFRALHHLLAEFPANHGVGASGLDFFAAPGVGAAAARRDILILASLAQALDRLAGSDFAPAFGRSTDLDDYRWGKLHRLTIDHAFIDPFGYTVPGGPYPPPFAGLPGVPVDGGFETIDRANHDVRAGFGGDRGAVNDFVFNEGPTHRFVIPTEGRRGPAAFALAGGVSGVPGSPYYANLLGPWLTNETVPFRFGGR